jgi:nucleotide-binding universal stress UspA family protein
MNTFRNVLVIHPFDQQALCQAVRLCDHTRDKVKLLAVAPLIERSQIALASGRRINLQQLIVNDLQRELDSVATGLRGQGARVQTSVVTGQPFYQIIRQVIRDQHDMVIMTADGQQGLRHQFLGTTAMYLMRKCLCPVWVVKPSRRNQIRKFLAAIDPSEDRTARNCLNAEILKRASYICRTQKAEFHVIHTWNPPLARPNRAGAGCREPNLGCTRNSLRPTIGPDWKNRYIWPAVGMLRFI